MPRCERRLRPGQADRQAPRVEGAVCAKALGVRLYSLAALLATGGWGRLARAVVLDFQGRRRAGRVSSCRLPASCLRLCVQELQELERKLEDALARQETAQLERALASRQQWAGDGPGLLNEAEDTDSERQVSAVLWRALSKSQKLLEHQQQR